MKLPHFFILLVLVQLLFVKCQTEIKPEVVNFEQVVSQLKTLEEKEAYLTKIFEDDQSVRQGNPEMLKLVHGADSEEYRSYMKTWHEQDSICLKKIETYLDLYGHPSNKDSMNYKAQTAVWAVIHHASDVEVRERNFEHMYRAYLKGDLDLTWYLERTYGMKLRKKFVMLEDSKYDNEIDQMIMELGLEEKKKRVEAEVQSL